VFIQDIATGYYWSQTLIGLGNPSGLGDFADFIDERMPLQNGYRPPLDMYNATSWDSMYVLRHNAGGSWSGVYNEPNEYWEYIFGNWGYLSFTSGTYSNNTMHDYWNGCS
jgi:hypothetical protein